MEHLYHTVCEFTICSEACKGHSKVMLRYFVVHAMQPSKSEIEVKLSGEKTYMYSGKTQIETTCMYMYVCLPTVTWILWNGM